MNNKVLSIILIIIIVIIVIYNNNIKYDFIKNKDMFTNQRYINPQDIIKNDGQMTFEYLNDPNYKKNVLNTFYLNDDIKYNGVKVNYHPYKNPVPNCPSSADLNPYVYSANPLLHCRRNVGNNYTKWWWHKYDTRAVDIHNQFSIHR